MYVGKSKDRRARVRSYFYGDSRRQVTNLLDEVTTVEAAEGSELEARAEARLIEIRPRYNRRGRPAPLRDLKLDLPRPSRVEVVARRAIRRRRVYGPSRIRRARMAKEALEEVGRSAGAPRDGARHGRPCALADRAGGRAL